LGHLGIKGGGVVSLALVLVVAAGLDALCLNMFTVEHEHMGFLVIDPDHGVKSTHGGSFFKNQRCFSAKDWQSMQRLAVG